MGRALAPTLILSKFLAALILLVVLVSVPVLVIVILLALVVLLVLVVVVVPWLLLRGRLRTRWLVLRLFESVGAFGAFSALLVFPVVPIPVSVPVLLVLAL